MKVEECILVIVTRHILQKKYQTDRSHLKAFIKRQEFFSPNKSSRHARERSYLCILFFVTDNFPFAETTELETSCKSDILSWFIWSRWTLFCSRTDIYPRIYSFAIKGSGQSFWGSPWTIWWSYASFWWIWISFHSWWYNVSLNLGYIDYKFKPQFDFIVWFQYIWFYNSNIFDFMVSDTLIIYFWEIMLTGGNTAWKLLYFF